MKYIKLAKLMEQLENTPSLLEKTYLMSSFIKEVPAPELRKVTLLLLGRIFPNRSESELEVGKGLLTQTLMKVCGVPKKEIVRQIKEKGDTGEAAYYLLKKRKQKTFFKEELDIERIFSLFRKIAEAGGKGAQKKKIDYLSTLLNSASPLEAKFISRTVTSDLRIGVGEGIMRDSLSKAFSIEKEVIDKAFSKVNDFALIAEISKKEGAPGLKKLKIEIFRPLKVMLAQKVETISEGIEKMDGKAMFEYKFDGFRVQIHIGEHETKIFTRNLDDVTKQFPDIEDSVSGLKKNIIIEGEAVGVKNGEMLPFQKVSRRIKRKYDIKKMAEKIPVITYIFDIIYDGEDLTGLPFSERRERLEKIVKENDSLKLSPLLETGKEKEAEEFYEEALSKGLEGVMIKHPKAEYKPGSRVGYMVKLKPVLETLDLIITGAEWGEGRRAHWFGTFFLSTREGKRIGRMATGLTDKQFEDLTEELKKKITSEEGKTVSFRPEVVVEVGYEEIQKSDKYDSGFALRFPRLVRFRPDKGPEDADNMERVRLIAKKQRGRDSPEN